MTDRLWTLRLKLQCGPRQIHLDMLYLDVTFVGSRSLQFDQMIAHVFVANGVCT